MKPTREEMAKECSDVADNMRRHRIDRTVGRVFDAAAVQLRLDGALRERLEKLVAEWRAAELDFRADELEAALKEPQP